MELLAGDTDAYNERVGRKIACPFGGCLAKFRRETDFEKHVELAHVGEEEGGGGQDAPAAVGDELAEEIEKEMFGDGVDAEGETDEEWRLVEVEAESEDL